MKKLKWLSVQLNLAARGESAKIDRRDSEGQNGDNRGIIKNAQAGDHWFFGFGSSASLPATAQGELNQLGKTADTTRPMNAVEHIVEAYYRICKKCFTMHDVKIPNGNNRQFDLLAVNLDDGSQFHVESSVTHTLRWCPDTAELKEGFDRKFLGAPAKREGPNRDFAKGKTYRQQILDAYKLFGMNPDKLQRVWVFWTVKDAANFAPFLDTYEKDNRIKIQVKSLRDEIIPELQKAVGTANYDDEVLRTLSLLKQMENQTQR